MKNILKLKGEFTAYIYGLNKDISAEQLELKWIKYCIKHGVNLDTPPSKTLQDKAQKIAYLYNLYLQGYKVADIARNTGISKSMVDSKILRLKLRLTGHNKNKHKVYDEAIRIIGLKSSKELNL